MRGKNATKRSRRAALWLAPALWAAGWSAAAGQESDAPAAVASIKPVHSLLAGVMEGAGNPPRLLVSGAASPHTYSLRPSDARALSEADLVVWVGRDLESFLVRPIETLAHDALVLELSQAEDIALLPTRRGGAWEEHDDHGGEERHGEHGEHRGERDDDREEHEHGHGEHDDDHGDERHDEDRHGHGGEHAAGHDDDAHEHREDGHGHDHGEYNPHLWLDPANAAAIADAMAHALARLDPARAALYRGNADALKARLEALDRELRATLSPVADRGFIVFHDAWQYLEARYGLRAVGSVVFTPGLSPGAARMAALRERLAATKAECVFAEPQFEPRTVRTLVAGTGAGSGVLDPLGADIDDGPDLYFTLMRSNAEHFRACFAP